MYEPYLVANLIKKKYLVFPTRRLFFVFPQGGGVGGSWSDAVSQAPTELREFEKYFLNSQPKHKLLVLKRTVSMRLFYAKLFAYLYL